MKYILLLLFSINTYAATKSLQGSVWYSNDLAKIFTPPSVTDTLCGITDTQTLTNKSISADSNTITNIDNNEIKAGAAIDYSKLASMSTGYVLAGNAGTPTVALLSGDATIGATGILTIANNAITNAKVSSSAAIDWSKMLDLTNSRLLVSNGSGDVSATSVTATEAGYLSGVTSAIQTQLDAKLSSNGTLNGGIVSGGTIANSVTLSGTITGGTVSGSTLSGMTTNTGTVSGGTIANVTMASIKSTGGGVLTIPASSADTFVLLAGNQTLSNKTFSNNTNMSGLTLETGLTASGTVSLSGTLSGGTVSNTTIQSATYTGKDNAFTLQDQTTPTKQLQFELSGITGGNTRTLTAPDDSGVVVCVSCSQTLTNKTLSSPTLSGTQTGGTISGTTVVLKDDVFTLQDNTTNSKQLQFQLSGISAATTRTITMSDANIELGKVPTVQRFLTGTSTYTTPSGVRFLEIDMCGGGGGGAGSGSGATNGGTGNNTTFSGNGIVLTAGGGAASDLTNRRGGAGGTNTASGTTVVLDIPGGRGGGAGTQPASQYIPGGMGGGSGFYGGGGGSGPGGDTGLAGSANTGGGGGGGGTNNTTTGINGGPGGGGGGCLKVLLTSPGVSYSVVVGGTSTKGVAGTGGFDGAQGASGTVTVRENYN